MELFDVIVSRAQYGDDNCVLMRDRIGDNVTFESFQNRDFKWHAGCYQTIPHNFDKFMESVIHFLNSIRGYRRYSGAVRFWLSTWTTFFGAH